MHSGSLIPLLCCAGADASTNDAEYRNALAAVHRFAEGGELQHLRAILDWHPRLVDARRPFAAGPPSADARRSELLIPRNVR